MNEIEKKAEEYAKNQAITSNPRYQIKCAYKEGYQLGFEIICKENKYLLDKLNLQNQRLIELKNENEEFKKQIKELKKDIKGRIVRKRLLQKHLDFFKKENQELKSQIEKMKVCENCEFWQDNDCIIEHDYDCKRWNNTNIDDYWELKK